MSNGVNDWLASVLKPLRSEPITANAVDTHIGMGRLINLETPITLKKAIDDVKAHIGIPHLRVGIGRNKNLGTFFMIISFIIN